MPGATVAGVVLVVVFVGVTMGAVATVGAGGVTVVGVILVAGF